MKVVVIGAGIMGNGIAQVSAMAGHDVVMSDVSPEALERALGTINTSLGRLVKAEKLTQDEADAVPGRINTGTDLAALCTDADVVIEAVTEVAEVKHEVIGTAVANAPSTALFGTNTSQISITSIGATIGDAADRLVGMHFFNPPVMMRLVELIRGLRTSDETLERAKEFALGLGKEVVVCQKDSPGFLTSRIAAILRLEALRMYEEGLGSAEDIDKAIRLAFNHPMGPLELGDFNGYDTYLHAVTALEKAHGERFRPTVTLKNMVAAGRLGRKTGVGFYRYDENGKKIGPA